MRFPIRLDQVVAAIGATRLPLENATVRLLAEVTSTTPEPRLEVKGAEPWAGRVRRVRVQCIVHAECLPFYVAVDWADENASKAALNAAAAFSSSGLRGPAYASQASLHGVFAPPAAQTSPQDVATGRTARPADGALEHGSDQAPALFEASVHAGTRATLLIDGQRLHIKVPVICLESGAPGRTIRVTALDHKQIYKAEVIDSTLLKGTL